MIALVAAAAAIVPSTAHAAFPGGNGRIAYEWTPPADLPRIFSVRPDGSGERQLTFGQPMTEDGSPAWSADGERLVFVRDLGPASKTPLQVSTIDADGGDLTPVVFNAGDPSFSPNGRRILLGAPAHGIVTVRAGGGKLHEVEVFGEFQASGPQYSPRGRRIVFAGTRRPSEGTSIWSVRRDGSGLRRLTDPGRVSPDHFDRAPDYSSDGRQIAFARGGESRDDTEIHVMRADGSDEHPIPGTEGAIDPAYSPAGDRIAISLLVEPSSEFFAGCHEIFTISPTGSGRQRVTENCEVEPSFDARAPSWQPDPPSTFIFGKVRKNKRRGTAKLTVKVPGPGGLELAKTGEVRSASRHAAAEGDVKLPVKPRGKARKRLRRDGSAKVRAEVTYTPDGAGPNTLSKRVKLVKRAR